MVNNKTHYLLKQIELLRGKMVRIAIENGFTSDESISVSRELDYLLNQYEEELDKNK